MRLPLYSQIMTVPLALPGIFVALKAMEAVEIFKRRSSFVGTISYSQRLLVAVSPCARWFVTTTDPTPSQWSPIEAVAQDVNVLFAIPQRRLLCIMVRPSLVVGGTPS